MSDGAGLVVLGSTEDVDRFLLSTGLDRAPAENLDLHRLWSFSGTGGAAAQVSAELAESRGAG